MYRAQGRHRVGNEQICNERAGLWLFTPHISEHDGGKFFACKDLPLTIWPQHHRIFTLLYLPDKEDDDSDMLPPPKQIFEHSYLWFQTSRVSFFLGPRYRTEESDWQLLMLSPHYGATVSLLESVKLTTTEPPRLMGGYWAGEGVGWIGEEFCLWGRWGPKKRGQK